jgi:hypothetical protein
VITDAADKLADALSGILKTIVPGKEEDASEKNEKTRFSPLVAKSLKRNLNDSAICSSPLPTSDKGSDVLDSSFPRTTRRNATSINSAP